MVSQLQPGPSMGGKVDMIACLIVFMPSLCFVIVGLWNLWILIGNRHD